MRRTAAASGELRDRALFAAPSSGKSLYVAGEAIMRLHMELEEATLFQQFVSKSTGYLEFGMGGSTVCASNLVRGPVLAIESDQIWIQKVSKLLNRTIHPRRDLFFVDIGPTKEWGYPASPHGEYNYLNYHETFWPRVDSDIDLYFVDGRFRIACLCQCLLRGRQDAIFGMHDYRTRRHYHIVETIARPIAEAKNLTFFARRTDVSRPEIEIILKQYMLDPA